MIKRMSRDIFLLVMWCFLVADRKVRAMTFTVFVVWHLSLSASHKQLGKSPSHLRTRLCALVATSFRFREIWSGLRASGSRYLNTGDSLNLRETCGYFSYFIHIHSGWIWCTSWAKCRGKIPFLVQQVVSLSLLSCFKTKILLKWWEKLVCSGTKLFWDLRWIHTYAARVSSTSISKN